MITSSSLPSPAGYSFGNHGVVDRTDDHQLDRNRHSFSAPTPPRMTILPAASSSSNSDVSPSPKMMNPAAITTASLSPTSSAGTTLSGNPSADTSLGVALCRSMVLNYIYLTYLFFVRLLALPSRAFRRLSLSRSNKQQQQQLRSSSTAHSPSNIELSSSSSSSSSSSVYNSRSPTAPSSSLHDEDDRALATASDQYVRQYTHLHHHHQLSSSPSSPNLLGGAVSLSSSSSSTSGLAANVGGTSMLRRSSRFKSKSQLEEIAQNSTRQKSLLSDHVQDDGEQRGEQDQQQGKEAREGTQSPSSEHPLDMEQNQALVTHSKMKRPGITSSAVRTSIDTSNTSNQPFALAGTNFAADRGILTDDGASSSSLRGPNRPSHARRLMMRMTGRPSAGLGRPNTGTTRTHQGPKKKTLVLDLDETLIHSTSRGSRSQGFMVEVLVDHHACLYYVYKRPHVDYFLKKVSEWYKLVIFTASMAEYADPVIDWLDQNRTLFARRYFRQACQFRNGSYLKDLTIIEPDLSSVCLLDNSPIAYSLNKENGIPIDSWFNDPKDEALLDLLPFLDALRFTDDVRSILSLRTI